MDSEEIILHERLASGGMGEIFRATQKGAGSFAKVVAVKRILPSLSDDNVFSKLFVREASITSRLQHPNIVQVYRSGQNVDGLYLVMELVDGQTLQHVLRKVTDRQQLIPVSLCCYIMAEAAKGLDFAHTLSDSETGAIIPIIHRDISPSNIMVSYNGEVKLLDFGFAKMQNMSSVTMVGELKGKASYFAPEVIEGLEADEQSDLFSLGVVFYELLTGKPLFHESTPLLSMAKIQKCEVPSVRTIRPEITPQLDGVVMSLLQRKQEARTRSARDLHRALVKLLTDDFAGTLPTTLGDYMQTMFSDEIRDMKSHRAKGQKVIRRGSTLRPDTSPSSRKGLQLGLLALLFVNAGLLLAYKSSREPLSPPVPLNLPPAEPTPVAPELIQALPGLIGWFSAEEVPGEDNDPIAEWIDISGRSAIAEQREPSHQPHIQRSSGAQRCTMKFDGRNSYMTSKRIAESLQQATSMTIFYVARSYGDAAQWVWSLQGKNASADVARAGFGTDGRTARIEGATLSPAFVDSTPILPQDQGCYRATFTNDAVSLSQNGVSIIEAPLARPLPFALARSFTIGTTWDSKLNPAAILRGDISEILIFSRTLSESETTMINRYLEVRYGCGTQSRFRG